MHGDDPDPYQEMRFLTGRLKEKDEENETESDWKFAAMVIDRWEYDMYNRWEYNRILYIQRLGIRYIQRWE